MTMQRGLFVRPDDTRGTAPVEARAALAGLVTPSTVGGVLAGMSVAGTDGWGYQVGTGAVTIVRGVGDGVIVAANDSATTVSCDPAPATGSRWDLIWAMHHDIDGGDADSEALFGVTSGNASGTPTKPYGAVPPGATVISEANLPASATNTLAASITQTARRIVGRGGIHPVRNKDDRTALVNELTAAGETPTPSRPLFVYRADAPAGARFEYTDDGSTWSSDTAPVTYRTGWATQGAALKVTRRNGGVFLTGRGARVSGTSVIVGDIPDGYRPGEETFGSLVAKNSGNAEGPRFEVAIGTGGTITVTQLSGGPTWGTGTWLPFNLAWPRA